MFKSNTGHYMEACTTLLEGMHQRLDCLEGKGAEVSRNFQALESHVEALQVHMARAERKTRLAFVLVLVALALSLMTTGLTVWSLLSNV